MRELNFSVQPDHLLEALADPVAFDRRKVDAFEPLTDADQAGDEVHHKPRIGGPSGVPIDVGAVLEERLEVVEVQLQRLRNLGIEHEQPGVVADGVDEFGEGAPAGHFDIEVRKEHTQGGRLHHLRGHPGGLESSTPIASQEQGDQHHVGRCASSALAEHPWVVRLLSRLGYTWQIPRLLSEPPRIGDPLGLLAESMRVEVFLDGLDKGGVLLDEAVRFLEVGIEVRVDRAEE